jgi:hypothetical protein
MSVTSRAGTVGAHSARYRLVTGQQRRAVDSVGQLAPPLPILVLLILSPMLCLLPPLLYIYLAKAKARHILYELLFRFLFVEHRLLVSSTLSLARETEFEEK